MPNLLKKSFLALDRILEGIIIAAFAAMLIIGAMQVFNRYILSHSLSWSEELQRYLHIWIVFLAIPLGYRRNAHIGMNVIYDKLPAAAKKLLDLLTHLLWLVLGVVMTIFTVKIATIAVNQKSPGLGIQMHWVYMCIIIGGIYLSVLAIRNIVTSAMNFCSATSKETV